MKLSSDFAILDVKKGRKKLDRHFAACPAMGTCPKQLRVPIVIHGYIESIWGQDDGTSQEFTVTVQKLEVRP